MSFSRAHWYLLALIPLVLLAFWPSYFATPLDVEAAFHAHGITASLWLIMLAWQSWTIHGGRRGSHRLAGRSSLALFPLFLAGGVGMFIGMARRFALEVSPFHAMYAPRLAWLDVIAVGGVSLFYYLALKHRRQVHVHARYMLATVLFLIPPILSRLSPFVPPLAVGSLDDLYKIGWGVQIANLITLLIALLLAFQPVRHGRPFIIAAILTALAMLLYQFAGPLPAWQALFATVADLPILPMAAMAGVAGMGIAWAGWIAGRRPSLPAAAAPA